MKTPGVAYEKSVFVNCPFDAAYNPLFQAIVFALHDLGFVARWASERDNAGEVRLEKLYEIIGECKYGIHDISRAEINSPELPRFNMPLELGIFLGCRRFGKGQQQNKSALILDSLPYRYLQFVTDLRGQDIKSHDNDPLKAIAAVRKWLSPTPERTKHLGAAAICARFQDFQTQLPSVAQVMGMTLAEMTEYKFEFVQTVANFIEDLDSPDAS